MTESAAIILTHPAFSPVRAVLSEHLEGKFDYGFSMDGMKMFIVELNDSGPSAPVVFEMEEDGFMVGYRNEVEEFAQRIIDCISEHSPRYRGHALMRSDGVDLDDPPTFFPKEK